MILLNLKGGNKMKSLIKGLSIIFSCLILASLMFTVQTYAIDSANIAGAWLFDEGSGDVANDSSTNDNNGKLVGDPQWVDGVFGTALDFNGTSDYVEIPDSESLDIVNAITISAWMYKRTDDIHGGTILGKWKQVGDVWSYVLYGLGDGGGGFRLRWSDGSQTNLEGPYNLPNEEWVHYAATYDGSTMIVFQNGEEIVQTGANKEINVTDNPLWIGNDGYQQHFNGILDEVAIFDVALSVNEIQNLMDTGIAGVLAVSPSDKMALTWGNIKTDY